MTLITKGISNSSIAHANLIREPGNVRMSDRWSTIPDELLEKIIALIAVKNSVALATLRLVCRSWKVVVSNGVTTLRPRTVAQESSIPDVFPNVRILTLSEGAFCQMQFSIRANTFPHASSACPLPPTDRVETVHRVSDVSSLTPWLQTMSRLVHLDLKNNCFIVDETLCNLRALTKLQNLNLSQNPQLTKDGLQHLHLFERLETLNVEGCWQLTDRALTQLSALTHLQCVNLRKCAITGLCLKALNQIAPLRWLNLSRCPQISHGALTILSPLSRLEHLVVDGMSATPGDENESALGFLTMLKSLSAKHTKFNDRHITYLKECTRLTSLDMSGNMKVTFRALDALAPICDLQVLKLECCRITRISQVLKFRILRQLSLRRCDLIMSEEFGTLTGLKSLRHLNIKECKISSTSFLALCTMHLTHWNAANCHMQGDTTRFSLNALLQAQYLNFNRLPVRRINFQKLGGSGELRHLNLSDSLIINEDLLSLTGLSKLVHLNVGRSLYLTDKALSTISALRALEHLDLTGSKCSHVGLREMSALSKLTSLNLSHCKLVDCMAIQWLLPLTSLRALQLRNTAVRTSGVLMLYPLQQLKSLDLSQCWMSSRIFNTLQRLPQLTQLDIRGCRLHTDKMNTLHHSLYGIKEVLA